MTTEKIESTTEAWESRLLGADETFVAAAEHVDESAIDEALGLKMISIRLEKSLIDDFKAIATINSMGYQTLMRQALKRFADSEKKLIAIDMDNRRRAEAAQARSTSEEVVSGRKHDKKSNQPKARKAA